MAVVQSACSTASSVLYSADVVIVPESFFVYGDDPDVSSLPTKSDPTINSSDVDASKYVTDAPTVTAHLFYPPSGSGNN